MTCTGNVDSYGIEQRSASGSFEEWGPTGLSGSWQRGPFSAGTTKMYCTYYYVGGEKHHAGDCITVTWSGTGGGGNAPRITLLGINGTCMSPGPCEASPPYSISWISQEATLCNLTDFGNVPTYGLVERRLRSGECDIRSPNPCPYGYMCVRDGTQERNYTLTCSNSTGSDSKSVRVIEILYRCVPY
jgi:hypothetical protein